MNKKLSILITSRNEEWLSNTIDDILANKEAETEIIVGLDGQWAITPLKQHKDVTIFYSPISIGQRGMINQLCRLSKAKYIMKVDAHCSFDKGFDKKMIKAMEEVGDNVCMVPIMKNLHVFDWVCEHCGHRRYQGKSGLCEFCGGQEKKEIIWKGKDSPNSVSYCFDTEPHFQYFKEYSKRPEYKKMLAETGLTETMSLQGSFFMMTRNKYWELNIGNENFGSWGSQGIQISLSFWLSGGRVICNHNCWYAHMFRTQGGSFGFPYKLSGKQVQHAKQLAKDLFFNCKFEKQTKPLSWLIEKFSPVYKWTDEDLEKLKENERKIGRFAISDKKISKGIIYYTDNQCPVKIAKKVQKQLRSIGLPIVSSSLKKMPHFGDNIHIKEKRGIHAYFTQILTALEASKSDIIFFSEQDCLYPPEHFNFTPSKEDTFYFNTNVYKVEYGTGRALKVDNCQQVSGMCCYRDIAIRYYKNKLKQVEENKFDGHYEPQHNRESWKSETPIIDIRHSNNLTKNRWDKKEFRNKKNTEGWKECTIKDIKDWEHLESFFIDKK